MTKAEFKRKAQRAFYRENPTCIIVAWLDAKLVTFPTGVTEWAGHFLAANSVNRRVMIATGADDYVMVR
jgi:hypothetical protein